MAGKALATLGLLVTLLQGLQYIIVGVLQFVKGINPCTGLLSYACMHWFFVSFLIVVVRAQVNCYSDETCGNSGGTSVVYETVLECCQQDDPFVNRSYAPVNGSDPCQQCSGTSKQIANICMLVFV